MPYEKNISLSRIGNSSATTLEIGKSLFLFSDSTPILCKQGRKVYELSYGDMNSVNRRHLREYKDNYLGFVEPTIVCLEWFRKAFANSALDINRPLD